MKTLEASLRSKEFALTAELSLYPGQSNDEIIEQARMLSAAADAIQVPDNRYAQPQTSNIAVAGLLLQEGISPVVHINSRDRNRTAFQSDLLGAQCAGVTDLLLMRGASPKKGITPKARRVFDVKASEMIATAAAITRGGAYAGGQPTGAPAFHVGSSATVFKPKSDWQAEKLLKKADAGAQFMQTQVCFNLNTLREYLARLIGEKLTWHYSFLVELAVLPSADTARKLRKLEPRALIPAAVVKRLEQAADAEAEGVQICAELLREFAKIPGIAGANLMTLGDPATIAAAIDASGLHTAD